MELSFTQVEIPATVSTRKAEPNPFDDVFPLDDKALEVVLPGTENDTEKDAKGNMVATDNAAAIRKVIAQARKAAQGKARTARIKKDTRETGTGKARHTETVLTIWTVAPIKRPRTNGNTPA